MKVKPTLLALALLSPMPALHAADQLVLAGATGAEGNHYNYLGYIQAFGGELDASGFRARAWADTLEYEYGLATLGKVEADAVGGKLMVGYQWVGASDTFAVWGGAIYRDTDLTPNDPNNESAADTVDGTLLAEYSHKFGTGASILMAAGGEPGFDSYWTRFFPAFHFGKSVKVGPDASWMGGESWRKQQMALTVDGIPLGGGVHLSLAGGRERDQTQVYENFGRLGLSVAF
jgi:hypothetical protein